MMEHFPEDILVNRHIMGLCVCVLRVPFFFGLVEKGIQRKPSIFGEPVFWPCGCFSNQFCKTGEVLLFSFLNASQKGVHHLGNCQISCESQSEGEKNEFPMDEGLVV